jgi:hypothetical protein
LDDRADPWNVHLLHDLVTPFHGGKHGVAARQVIPQIGLWSRRGLDSPAIRGVALAQSIRRLGDFTLGRCQRAHPVLRMRMNWQ